MPANMGMNTAAMTGTPHVESCLDGVFPLGEVDILLPLLLCYE